MAKILALLGMLSAMLALATSPGFGQAASPQPGRVYKVGFSQIVDHPALNETRAGFVDGLKQAGFEEGKNLVFLYQNAQGDVGNARNIAEKFLADGVDLLAPCTTPNAQATVRLAKGGKIPVVFGCVTDPVSAGILDSVERPSGTNVTGLYNPLPISDLFDLFLKIQPGLKTAGNVYNASESNSMAINRQAKAEAERRGIKWIEATVTGSADVKTTAESLLGKVDAFVLGQDNTVASAFEAVVKIAAGRQAPDLLDGPASSRAWGSGLARGGPVRAGRALGDRAGGSDPARRRSGEGRADPAPRVRAPGERRVGERGGTHHSQGDPGQGDAGPRTLSATA